MDTETSNVVGMCFELYDLFASIEIVAPEHKVITTADEPILPCDESASSDGNIRYFKGLDYRRRLVIVEQYLAIIHGRQYPWLRRMKVNLRLVRRTDLSTISRWIHTDLTRSLRARCVRCHD